MGDKDIIEKTLESYNDVFADIVNGLLFEGKQLVNPDDLESTSENSMYKADGKNHQQTRDVAKYWKNGKIQIAFYGIENQTVIDEDMPFRILNYDGASYRNQLNKGKRRYPVVTLVLYFGDKIWEKPKCLYDCLNIPEPLKKYVSDYKINVFEITKLTDKQITFFKSDFKIIADYFVHKEKYKASKDKITHVSEFLNLMSVLTNDSRFEMKYNEVIKVERGGVNMCEVLDIAENKGIIKGRKEGLAMSVQTLLKSMTVEQVADALKLSIEKVVELSELKFDEV